MKFARSLLMIVFASLIATNAWAQTKTETLADIRQELSFLYVEIQQLKTELSTTGNAGIDTGGTGATQQRLDTLEGELRRITGNVEELQFRIEKIVKDGTNRIGDLEFRLVELEGGDVSKLGETTTLGGDQAGKPPILIMPPQTPSTDLAVGEQADFDAAKLAYDDGEYQSSADLFAAYADTYPGGVLSGDAQYWRGEALASLGDWNNAARSFLQSFSAAPKGDLAPNALFRLGFSLNEIGQQEEACLTLNEVDIRYPGSDAGQQAKDKMQALKCGA
ncbi:MAG: tol-pal system protein YbgF [Alphaproteobacteria bacterium]|nr:tol-pal system protein YbgF [Alphaproteobacteria bacterium]